jgi:hypothetical protein
MEEIVKTAFRHVEIIGPHVEQGHYDILGPDGAIILPQVWDKIIQPGWHLTMQMWPMSEAKPSPPQWPPKPPQPISLSGTPAAAARVGKRPPRRMTTRSEELPEIEVISVHERPASTSDNNYTRRDENASSSAASSSGYEESVIRVSRRSRIANAFSSLKAKLRRGGRRLRRSTSHARSRSWPSSYDTGSSALFSSSSRSRSRTRVRRRSASSSVSEP